MGLNGAAWLTAGLVLCLLGVLALLEAWRRRGRPHAPWLVGGWALLLVSAVPFFHAASGESGVAAWMTAAGLLPLVVIGLRTEWRRAPDQRRKPQRVSAAGAGVDPGTSAASTPWRTAAVVGPVGRREHGHLLLLRRRGRRPWRGHAPARRVAPESREAT